MVLLYHAQLLSKDPATRNDFVNDIVDDGKHFHRRRWPSTIATISSKLDMLTFDQRLQRFSVRSGYLRSIFNNQGHAVFSESKVRRALTNGVSKHSCSFIPVSVKVVASRLSGAVLLPCIYLSFGQLRQSR